MATGIKIDILRTNLRMGTFSTMRVNGKQNFSDGLTKFLAAAGFLVFAEAGASSTFNRTFSLLAPSSLERVQWIKALAPLLGDSVIKDAAVQVRRSDP